MARNTGTFSFSANFEPKIALPLDSRMLVGTKADLTSSAMLAPDGFNATYKGMIVSVANDSTPENNGIYMLTDADYTQVTSWTRIGANESVVTGDTISGDGTVGNPLDVVPGEVDHNSLLNYSVDEHRTINDTGTDTTDLWSASKINTELGNKQSTSEKGQPNGYASLDANGKVPSSELTIAALEYKGTFDADTGSPDLKDGTGNTGDLYIVNVAGTHDFGPVTPRTVTFSLGDWALYNGTIWEKVINSNITYTFSTGLSEIAGVVTVDEANVDHNNLKNYLVDEHRTINDSGTGLTDLWSASKISGELSTISGDIVYTNTDPTPIAVGGIGIGETFTEQTITEMFDRLLYPTLYPTLVAPSMTSFSVIVSGTGGNSIREIGETVDLDFTANFSRGSITPAYGTSGFRSGPANTYNYTGTGLPATFASTSNTDNQSVTSYTIITGNNTWSAATSHDIGEQPLDSKGGNYDSPYPAGTVSAINCTVVGTYPIFATTTLITETTKQTLISLATTTVTVSMVAESGSDKQVLEVPEAFFAALTKLEQFVTVSSTWQEISTSTFTMSTVYTKTIQGNSVNYYSFTHNGSLIGARQLRFTFSKS